MIKKKKLIKSKKIKSKKITKKPNPRKILHGKVWTLFSRIVREEEAYICYTCGLQFDKYTTNAGHFHHGKLDFDRVNIHCQCIGCNKYKHGNLGLYAIHLVKQYGIEVVDDLALRANTHLGYPLEELEKLHKELSNYGVKPELDIWNL